MRIAVGVVALIPGLLYLGQGVSVANLELAQRLGLQENPGRVDPLFTRLEVWTARWDLIAMWPLPVAGVLILVDHSWWPYVAMIGGGAAFDTGGREIVKGIGLRDHGVTIGGPGEQRTFFGTLALISLAGLLAAVAGLVEVV